MKPIIGNFKEYQICNRCIMDTSDPEIIFDQEGKCNHCNHALETASKFWFPNAEGEKTLLAKIEKIRKENKNKEYDCIVGLSGGVDSSYMLYKAIEYGLRPLVVHVDCGWNSELAVKNIENLVKAFKLDLHTHVVDWEEMKDLQLAFFKANVANQDVPQDHAIFAGLYQFAVNNGIKYVLNGSNFATESILPESWGYNALDFRHIKSIHNKFGKLQLKQYPYVSLFKRYIYFTFIRKMQIITILNYFPYNKEDAIKILGDKYNWRYYGGKHHESRFTRFFQAYYLPKKFGYDKKRAHLSSLIVVNQLSREQALLQMQSNEYTIKMAEEDLEYVAKKLDLSVEEFEGIIHSKNKSYKDYKNNETLFKLGFRIRKFIFNK